MDDTKVRGRGRTSAAQTTARDVEFTFLDLFPVGFITMIGGNPDTGKSLLSYLIAADETRNKRPVVFCSYEETREHVWRPRIEAAKGDLDICYMHPEIMFSTSPDDVATLDSILDDTGARMLIVDPIMNHAARSIITHPTLARRDLRGMEEIISQRQVAAIFLHHTVKRPAVDSHPLTWFSGSGTGVPAVARSCWIFARSPEDEDVLILANAKHNLAAKPESRAFEVQTRRLSVLSADRTTTVKKDIPYLAYLGPSDIDARALGPMLRGAKPPNMIEQARGFLFKVLEDGPLPVREIKREALIARVADRTMYRAAEGMGIEGIGHGEWSLPPALAGAARKIKEDKLRLDGEHAETHLEPDEIAEVLKLLG
jgi:AAA domain